MKNTPNIAPVGSKQPLGVICGPERHLFKTDGYLKMPPVAVGIFYSAQLGNSTQN